jgi:polar amino acid transport system substrate-binding protein
MRAVAIALIALMCLARPAAAEVPGRLRACGDANEWPPFTFFKRVDGRKTEIPTGFSVEFLAALLKAAGRTVAIDMLPWNRCVLLGARGDYDVLFDGFDSAERRRDFAFTQPLYAVRAIGFYRRQEPPPALHGPADFSRISVCGVLGYNYEPAGIPGASITTRARSLEGAARMLQAGHCDLLPTFLEVARAVGQVGGHDLFADPSLASIALPGAAPIEYHLIVSRAVPYRDELVALLDRGIAAMTRSGEAGRLRGEFLGDGPDYLPSPAQKAQ